MLVIRKLLFLGEKIFIRDVKLVKKILDSINILCLFIELVNILIGSFNKYCDILYVFIIILIIFVDILYVFKYGFWKGIYIYCEN